MHKDPLNMSQEELLEGVKQNIQLIRKEMNNIEETLADTMLILTTIPSDAITTPFTSDNA